LAQKSLLAILLLVTAFGAHAAPSSDTAVDPGLLAGLRARSIGPAGMSGRVAALEAVASDPSTVWVGAASGGVWKSVDGGVTWQPVFDDQPVASIGALAIDQANPDIVWVGTGEGNPRNSVSVGNGVYRTLDGGRTWTHLGLAGTERIHRIVLHPSRPEVAWVAALGRAWGDSPERGVYKTVDGGRTWKRVLFADETTGAADLVIDPENPDKLFASLWQYRREPWIFRSGGPGSGLHVTHDGGATWMRITEDDGLPKGDLGRIGLSISRQNPDVVYAMVEAKKSALARSDDGGRTWKIVNDRYDVNPRPFYFGDVRADPVWPNRVYSLDYDVRVSEDGGRTFTKLIDGYVIHGDFHAMWIDPGDPDHLLVGGDGGIGISHDRGKTARFVTNLPLAQYYHVAVDLQTPYNVYGGLQDNGSWRGPSTVWQAGGIRNHHWIPVGVGDGFETLPDLGDPGILYSMYQGGNLGRYEVATGQIRDIKPSPPEGIKLRFNWNAGLATDPFHPGTIYLGSQFLHKSADRGETWTVISPDLTTNNPAWQRQSESGGLTPDVTGAENFTTILAIAPSPLQDGVIWVGTDDGRVHVTRDGGAAWQSVEKNLKGVPANTWVPEIRPSRHDPASAFVVLDNHRRSDWTPYVYRTDDWGKTWKSLATPDLRGYALAFEQDPVDPDLLFLGTEFGLWVSLDAGRRWMRWTHGLPTVSVMDLAIHPREHDLVIATHGRGLYVLDDLQPLRTLSAATLREPVHLFPIVDARQHARRAEDGGLALGFSEFRGESRPYGALLTYSLNAPGLPLPDEDRERERKEKERAEKRKAGETAPRAAPTGEDEPAPGAAPEAAVEPAEGEAAGETPKVEIRITDAIGRVVRRFKAPARQGVSRAVWDLRRDEPAQFPQDPADPAPEDPSGTELPPGTYGVAVKLGNHEAQGTVRVLPDPRSPNTEADWQTREAAIQRVDALRTRLIEAVERVRDTRSDLDLALDRVRRRRKEKDIEGEAEAALRKSARALRGQLTSLERKLWVPYDTVGIVGDSDLWNRLSYIQGYAIASWSPPSPNHLELLRQIETDAEKVLADLDRFFTTEVPAFRQQAREAGAELLPPAMLGPYVRADSDRR
jgi:photosystem II stability/assembly factor-like uncharacterized protein